MAAAVAGGLLGGELASAEQALAARPVGFVRMELAEGGNALISMAFAGFGMCNGRNVDSPLEPGCCPTA